jgi:hypothetical protein
MVEDLASSSWPSRLVEPDVLQPGRQPAKVLEVSSEGVKCTFLGTSGTFSAVADRSAPKNVSAYYFEMKVLEAGSESKVSLGFFPEHAKLNLLPGCASCCDNSTMTI